MASNALDLAPLDSPKVVRLPSLERNEAADPLVDTLCDTYRAGYEAGLAEGQAAAVDLEGGHAAFAQSVSAMLDEMDGRYRRECLALTARMFGAVAPTLARQSSIQDLLQLIEERVVSARTELTLRIHPDLVGHLSERQHDRLSENPLIKVTLDNSCSPSQIDAKWATGGLFHDPDALIAEMTKTLGAEAAPKEESE